MVINKGAYRLMDGPSKYICAFDFWGKEAAADAEDET